MLTIKRNNSRQVCRSRVCRRLGDRGQATDRDHTYAMCNEFSRADRCLSQVKWPSILQPCAAYCRACRRYRYGGAFAVTYGYSSAELQFTCRASNQRDRCGRCQASEQNDPWVKALVFDGSLQQGRHRCSQPRRALHEQLSFRCTTSPLKQSI